MHIHLTRSIALLAATVYIAAVAVLIQAIATQARIKPPHVEARQPIALSPLNLDDPCNRSNAVEIKFCGTGSGATRMRHRLGQTPSTHVSGRAAVFDTQRATAGAYDARALQELVER